MLYNSRFLNRYFRSETGSEEPRSRAIRIRHNTEPRVLPYKLAATVHVPSNVVGLTTQKYRFPIPCIKPHLIAPKKCRPHRPVRSCLAVKSEKDAQKLQYFL